MKNLLFTLVLAIPALAQTPAQAPTKPAPKPESKPAPTLAKVLDSGASYLEGHVVPAAEAMPESAYGFVPATGEFKGVRTFAQQVKHIALVNYLVASAILGEKAPVESSPGEDGPASIKSKAEIVAFLKDSFAYAHKAIGTLTDQNALAPIQAPWGGDTTRLRMAAVVESHGFDHYGQMAVSLRLNGIIPPASRK